jgi:alpha-glucan,water dikinase
LREFWLSLQGIEDKFLEQWHQKLHTNTTPADITICEAYIDFLHSGDGGHFWHALWEKGGLTRETLATMDHPITGPMMRLSAQILEDASLIF